VLVTGVIMSCVSCICVWNTLILFPMHLNMYLLLCCCVSFCCVLCSRFGSVIYRVDGALCADIYNLINVIFKISVYI
jgi:hypothetical protein